MTKKTERQQTDDKLNLFMDFFSLCEEKGILLDGEEFRQITAFAIKDLFIDYAGQNVKTLVDIKIEDLSQRNTNIIIKRARTALKRILEMKKKYSAGPFSTNRHLRRASRN